MVSLTIIWAGIVKSVKEYATVNFIFVSKQEV